MAVTPERETRTVLNSSPPQSSGSAPSGRSGDSSNRPRLIITIDTEEEGLWGGRYRMTGNTVENIRGVPRFQTLCDQLGIRPVYLADAPVVQDDRASAILGEIHAAGGCEIGTHVHPWCNPPIDEVADQRESYLCNLPVSLQRAKIAWLTEAISERFGQRPVSFRAGRYGLDIAGARILAELGYRVDSSVIPFTDYSADRGPDFSTAPWQPYFVGDEDLCGACESGQLLEVPVSVGFNRRSFSRAMQCQSLLGRAPFRWLRLEGILDRAQVLKRIKLSPEKATARDMQTLIDRFCESPSAVLVMMFHSSSLVPGESPYVRDEADLEEFLERIAETCRYFLESKAGVSCTLEEVAGERQACRRAAAGVSGASVSGASVSGTS